MGVIDVEFAQVTVAFNPTWRRADLSWLRQGRTQDCHGSQGCRCTQGRERTDAGIAFDSVDRPMVAENLVPLGAEDARKVLKMVDALDDLDDVAEIYVNFDISDEILATLS